MKRVHLNKDVDLTTSPEKESFHDKKTLSKQLIVSIVEGIISYLKPGHVKRRLTIQNSRHSNITQAADCLVCSLYNGDGIINSSFKILVSRNNILVIHYNNCKD